MMQNKQLQQPCKFGLKCKFRPNCHFVHPEGEQVIPQLPAILPCRFGASCRNKGTPAGCPFDHSGAAEEETKETQLNIFEKGKIIHAIEILIGQKCKFNQGCTSYKCAYEHETPTGNSPAANSILNWITKKQNIQEEENKKKEASKTTKSTSKK